MPASIQVLSRALQILEILTRRDAPLPLAEIAEMAGLPKSSAHRVLMALEAEGFVRPEGQGLYTVGMSMICLAGKVIRRSIVFQAARFMRELRDRTQCTVYLSTINDFELVYLHRAPGPIAPVNDIGYVGDIYYGTGGRAILSTYPRARLDELFRKRPLIPRTPLSLTTPEAFLKELDETRRRGYARAVGEYIPGVSGIGAPVYDHTGECVAALSLSAVVGTIPCDVEDYAGLLLRTAAEISQWLGHKGSAAN